MTPDGYFVKATHSYDGWGSLALHKTTLDDVGTYFAIASNEGGKAESSAQLSVVRRKDARRKQSLSLLSTLSDTQLTEGETLLMTVKPSTECELKWKRQGLPITTSDNRIKIIHNPDGSQSLEVRFVDKFDAGRYSVVATNGADCITSTANVSIQAAAIKKSGDEPRFLVGLKNLDTDIGSLIKLMVKVAGSPEPKIKWLHNGQPIVPKPGYVRVSEYPDGTHTLVLTDVQPEQVGTYSCIALNDFGTNSTTCDLDVLSRPVLIKGLKDQKINEGDTLTFEIRYEGFPQPSIKWMRNGEEIISDGLSAQISDIPEKGLARLVIQNVKPSDAGDYRVAVANIAGQLSSYANLSVVPAKVKKTPAEPPIFVVPMEDAKVNVNQMAKFEIEIRGYPEPTLKWYHNDKPISKQRGTIQKSDGGDGSAAMSINAANLSDAGEYKAVATNKHGTAESKATLTVVSKPTITLDLKNAELEKGSPLNLKLEFNGYPTPNIEWLHDGETISPNDDRYKLTNENGIATLTLLDTNVGDGGDYRASITNEVGAATSNATVSISTADADDQDKPAFIHGLYNRSVEAGKPIELSVRVCGKPEPMLTWLHNGKKLDNTDDNIQAISKDAGNYSVRICMPAFENAGEYRAIASNAVGTASTSGNLTVLSRPEIIEHLHDLDLVEGESIKLSVQVKSSPAATVQWHQNGIAILPDNRFIREIHDTDGTHTLIISKAKIDNSGEYRVTATNELGTAVSDALVSVQTKSDIILEHGAKPHFEKGLQNANIDIGSTIQLEVEVSGEPKPTLKWLHNGEVISPDKHHLIISQPSNQDADNVESLRITSATIDDAGKYSVIATNESGTSASDCVLSVDTKPVFVTPLKDQYVIEGDAVKFEVKVIGTQPLNGTWLHKNKKLSDDVKVFTESKPDGSFILSIENASPANIGTYTFVAANEHGTAESSANLHVSPNFDLIDKPSTGQKPVFTKQLSDLRVFSGFPAKFEVICVGSPLPTLKWCHETDAEEIVNVAGVARTAQNPDGTAYLLLTECQLDDIGRYKVIATNDYGTDVSCCQLTVVEESKPLSCHLGKHSNQTDEGI